MSKAVTFQPIKTEPAFRLTARVIEEKILSGELSVGDVLPAEMALGEMLGVNRSTVREAIRLLEENGLVGRKQGGKKLFVTVPEKGAISQRLISAMILQQVTFEDLWQTLHALEPEAAEEAARRTNAEVLAELDENLAETERSLGDSAKLAQLDLEFHNLIAEASGNLALQLSRQPISALFYPAFEHVLKRDNAGDRLLEAHRQIVNAIKAADGTLARDWMTKHIVDFKRGVELGDVDMSQPVRDLGQKTEGGDSNAG